jgi:hypothetical protein
LEKTLIGLAVKETRDGTETTDLKCIAKALLRKWKDTAKAGLKTRKRGERRDRMLVQSKDKKRQKTKDVSKGRRIS